MDTLTPLQRHHNMQAIKSRGTSIEIKFGKALWNNGVRYRKNTNKIFGRPDFSIKKYKIAIFCDSEFWHGKDWEKHKNDIKTNSEFWVNKIERNRARDNEVSNYLTKQGWTVLRFWGKEINTNLYNCVAKVEKAIKRAKTSSIDHHYRLHKQ